MFVTLVIFLVIVGGAFLLGTRFPDKGTKIETRELRLKLGLAEETIHACANFAIEDADRGILSEQILYETRMYHVNGREITA